MSVLEDFMVLGAAAANPLLTTDRFVFHSKVRFVPSSKGFEHVVSPRVNLVSWDEFGRMLDNVARVDRPSALSLTRLESACSGRVWLLTVHGPCGGTNGPELLLAFNPKLEFVAEDPLEGESPQSGAPPQASTPG